MLSWLIDKFEQFSEQELSEGDFESPVRVFEGKSVRMYQGKEVLFMFKNDQGFFYKMKFKGYEVTTNDQITYLIYEPEHQLYHFYEDYLYQFSFQFEDGSAEKLILPEHYTH